MLDVNISDNRLHFKLASYLKKFENGRTAKLKGLKLCGSKVMNVPTSHAVEVLASEDDAHFFGTTTCHSAWACPRCTAKVMAAKSTRIACLIDALAKQHLRAFMLTFTLPHTDSMTCEQAFDVLQATWRMFSRDGNKAKNSQNKAQGTYGQFREKFGIRYFVRVFEFTWGDAHGWHPHIHALFWTHEDNFGDLLEWENKLTDRWIHCAKVAHLHMLRGDFVKSKFRRAVLNCKKEKRELTPEQISFVNNLYADYKRRPVTGHRAVYFSRDNKGRVKVESSSHYISGWGANSELTRENLKDKHAMGGRYSPFEMLNLAVKATTAEVAKHWFNLFIEYALTTVGHRRCCFAPGCNEIIDEYQKTEDYLITFQKKITESVPVFKKVFWFNAKQWSDILTCENCTTDIRSEILKLALQRDCQRRIADYLLLFGIDVRENMDAFDKAYWASA